MERADKLIFFPIISYFPPITIIEITTGPSGQQMIFLFSQVSISVWGKRKTPTQSKTTTTTKNTHNQKKTSVESFCYFIVFFKVCMDEFSNQRKQWKHQLVVFVIMVLIW